MKENKASTVLLVPGQTAYRDGLGLVNSFDRVTDRGVWFKMFRDVADPMAMRDAEAQVNFFSLLYNSRLSRSAPNGMDTVTGTNDSWSGLFSMLVLLLCGFFAS